MKPKTTSELREEVEKQVEYICDLSGYGQALHPNDIRHCFKTVIHQREQQIYAELMEKIEPPKEWRHCLKVAFGQEETCALCGFCPEKLKSIINNILKHE